MSQPMASPVALARTAIDGGVGTASRHDSGAKHVSGEAIYIDDIPEPPGLLHVHIAYSRKAHAAITAMDLAAVRAAPGVVAVFAARDIPGTNDVSPVAGDDPMFADGLVEYWGQSLFAVAAESREQAWRAAQRAEIAYDERPAILTIDEAMAAASFLDKPYTMARGDAAAAIDAAPRQVTGRIEIGGQEHFYLEGQAALAVPGEDEDVTVYSSTQHPSEVQHKVSTVLGVGNHAVTVEVRRMGGGFGGKESQANLPACVAALAAKLTGRPAKVVYDRDDDMMITGKRHDFRIDYRAGFDADGRILGVEFDHALRCGMSWDLSEPIGDRAMFHADNCYYLPDVRITSYRCKTNTQSNTAFRGFGGPQGMVGMERVIDHIAHELGKDPLEVRRVNFYDHKSQREGKRRLTPYGMAVEDCIIQDIVDELAETSGYLRRREDIRAWNETSPILKRGIALTPLKFGISFTKTFLNQAGALVNVYTDGSIQLNHGGTEMGQGLFTKVAQIVAEEFQVDISRVKITATTTAKVPNTSATAASSGSDLNGMAAQHAARTIKRRLAEFLAERFQTEPERVEFLPGRIRVGETELSFESAIQQAGIVKLTDLGRISVNEAIMNPPRDPLYRRHRFPAEVIGYAVWLYFRFPLSLRMVEEMLAARGVDVSHESVRSWAEKFGREYSNRIRRRAPARGDKWHLDEVVITICSRKHWLWRAVDQMASSSTFSFRAARDRTAARRLMRKLLKRLAKAPRVLITDKLKSYGAARKDMGLRIERRQHKGLNNRAENSHLPTRRRERIMKRFKSPRHVQRFLSIHDQVANLFHFPRNNLSAIDHRVARAKAFSAWAEIAAASLAK